MFALSTQSFRQLFTPILKVVFLATLLIPFHVFAQSKQGDLLITVIDGETRRTLNAVEIRVKARDGAETILSTGTNGRTRFRDLDAGLFEVNASKPGYTQALEPSVRIIAGKATPLQIELRTSSRLEEVLVESRAVIADQTGSASASYYDRETLRSAPGSGSDVLRALDGLPGLVSTGDFASFTVRGRGPRDNLILVDDIPFSNVVHFDQSLGELEDIDGGGRFSVFAPNLINGVEYQPGGWGAAYGGRAGSFLNLNVADGNPETPSFSTRIDLAGVEVGYDGPSYLHENTSILFNARQLDFGRLFETIGEDDIGDPELTDVIFKSNTQINADNELDVLMIYAPEEFTRDIENVLESPDFDDVSIVESEQDNVLIAVTWSHLFGETGELINRLYTRNTDKSSSQGESFPDLVPQDTPPGDIPVREEILRVDEDEEEIGLRTDVTFLNGWGELSFGTRITQLDIDYAITLAEDWIRYVYDQNDFRESPDQRFIVWRPENFNSTLTLSEVSYAGYVEQEFDLADWSLRTGIRYDHDAIADEDLVSPRLGVDWEASPLLTVSFTAGVFYQSPRFLDRATDPRNVNLENEEVTQFSVGIDRQLGNDWNVIVETYYQDLDNLVTKGDGTDGIATNDGEGTSTGFDIAVNKSFSNGWSASSTYSYNDAMIDDNDGTPEYVADFNREHAFSISGIWEISDRWKISARWKFLSGRPADDFIVYEDVLGPGEPTRFSKELTTTNTRRLDDFHSLNMRVDYRQTFGQLDIIAFIDVINLYGADNTNSEDFNERRGVNVVEEGDTIPQIGLRFEF